MLSPQIHWYDILLLHGIPETELDTDAAVMSVCSEKKAREMDNVENAWTIDGRIVCLLRSGRKETVVNESELSNLRRDD